MSRTVIIIDEPVSLPWPDLSPPSPGFGYVVVEPTKPWIDLMRWYLLREADGLDTNLEGFPTVEDE